MLTMINKQLQIFRSIIINDTIFMMHNFFWLKIASKFLFHYKARTGNITSIITKRMFRFKKKNSPISNNYNTVIFNVNGER